MPHDSHHNFFFKIDGVEHSAEHPVTTGQKLLALTGKDPETFLLALRVPNQPEQLIGLEEEFDLRTSGTEHFVTVDRTPHYSIRVDESVFRIASRYVNGLELLKLVGKSPETHYIVQIIPHADDIEVGLDQRVDLAQPGTERFDVVRKQVVPLYIIIDDVRYTPGKDTMTGQELRALPNPPIAASRDLWLDVPGKDDLKISSTQVVQLKSGFTFYTAPATINPGVHSHAAN